MLVPDLFNIFQCILPEADLGFGVGGGGGRDSGPNLSDHFDIKDIKMEYSDAIQTIFETAILIIGV